MSDTLRKEFDKQLVQEMSHNRLSPSASSCWTLCTASVEARASVDEDDISEASALGTVLHTIASAYLVLRYTKGVKEFLSIDATFLGAVINYKGVEVRITSDDLDKVKSYTSYIAGFVLNKECTSIEIEPHVQILGITSGYIDCRVRVGNDIWIIDLKTGFVTVEPEDNDQLSLYGLSQIEEDFENIHIVIHQNSEAKVWTLTHAELASRAKKYLDAARKVGEDPQFFPGDHCKKTYCGFISKCNAVIDKIKEPIQGESTLSIAERLELADMAEAFARRVKADAFKALEKKPDSVPGWTISTRNGHRKWVNESLVVNSVPDFAKSLVMETKIRTPASFENKVNELIELGVIEEGVDLTKLVKQDKSRTLKRLKGGEKAIDQNRVAFAHLL